MKCMTKKEFFRRYQAQHKDIRGKSDGSASRNLASIIAYGFKPGIGCNILPVYDGRESNLVERHYGNRAGDTVYLIPEQGIDAVLGDRVSRGWMPSESDVIFIEYDGQTSFDAYNKRVAQLQSYVAPNSDKEGA